MARTPQDWLVILSKRMDQRKPRIGTLRRYQNGNAPMPEMGKNVRASWEKFQKKARTNTGGLIVEALAERIKPNGIVVGDDSDSELSQAAKRIWRENRMDVQFADALRDVFGASVGYLVVGLDADGRAMITAEKPEHMIASVDPLRPWMARAGLKVWRDIDDGHDYAIVWAEGVKQTFARESVVDDLTIATIGGDWEPFGEPEEYTGQPPIVVMDNLDQVAEFEPHIDIIDRINLGILQRLVVVSMQAYRQRALQKKSDEGGTVEYQDADGNDIDFTKIFEPAPGALWDLPEGFEIWESSATDLTPMLSAVRDDYRDLSAATRTPLGTLMPDKANQSAEGARGLREGLVMKADDRIKRLKPALSLAMKFAMHMEGHELDDLDIDILFDETSQVSLPEKYAAAQQAKAIGLAIETVQRNVLGWSPEQIREDAAARSAEQLEQMAFFDSINPPAQQPQQQQAIEAPTTEVPVADGTTE